MTQLVDFLFFFFFLKKNYFYFDVTLLTIINNNTWNILVMSPNFLNSHGFIFCFRSLRSLTFSWAQP